MLAPDRGYPFQMGISEIQSMMTFTSLLTFLDFDGFSRKEGEEQKQDLKPGRCKNSFVLVLGSNREIKKYQDRGKPDVP